MNRLTLLIGCSLCLGLLSLGYSGCQPAAPDTNREAAKTTNANVLKETVDNAAIESELLRLEREWAEAGKSHNPEAVRNIVADDVVMTYPDGTTGTKADELRDVGSGALTVESWDVVEPKVTVINADAAVVIGRTSIKKGKYKGSDGRTSDISGEYRFTDVFARRNGKWQVIASQATKIENPGAMASPMPKSSPVGSPSAPPEKTSPMPAAKATP